MFEYCNWTRSLKRAHIIYSKKYYGFYKWINCMRCHLKLMIQKRCILFCFDFIDLLFLYKLHTEIHCNDPFSIVFSVCLFNLSDKLIINPLNIGNVMWRNILVSRGFHFKHNYQWNDAKIGSICQFCNHISVV